MKRRATRKLDPRPLQRSGDTRLGHTYFVNGDRELGYGWILIAPDNDTIATSALFARKADCLKALRAVQRHGSSMHIIDEAAD